MKYCEDCGFGCDDLARFCNICGYQFKIDAVEEAVSEEVEKELDDEATTLLLEEDVEENVQQELDKKLEDDAPEYYKQEMLQNKQMIDDLMKQQKQLQMQLDTMKKQQWKQAEQQQKQQNQLNQYNYQAYQQRVYTAQPQAEGTKVRNMWSFISAIVCLLPFFISNFAKEGAKYYNVSYGFAEFCGEAIDYLTYGSEDSITGVISRMLPLLVIGLVVVLIICGYKPMPKLRGWTVVANIVAIITMFFYVKAEGFRDVSFGISFWILIIGVGMATYSCWTDEPEPKSQMGYGVGGSSYNLSLLAAETPIERSLEWRCPKCDSRNSMDYKFCKTCSTSRPIR